MVPGREGVEAAVPTTAGAGFPAVAAAAAEAAAAAAGPPLDCRVFTCHCMLLPGLLSAAKADDELILGGAAATLDALDFSAAAEAAAAAGVLPVASLPAMSLAGFCLKTVGPAADTGISPNLSTTHMADRRLRIFCLHGAHS